MAVVTSNLLIALVAWAPRFVNPAARKQAYLAGLVVVAIAVAHFAWFVVPASNSSGTYKPRWPAAVLVVVLALRRAKKCAGGCEHLPEQAVAHGAACEGLQ